MQNVIELLSSFLGLFSKEDSIELQSLSGEHIGFVTDKKAKRRKAIIGWITIVLVIIGFVCSNLGVITNFCNNLIFSLLQNG